jgi:phosphoribosyl-ATP pyrophosphohydrolase
MSQTPDTSALPSQTLGQAIDILLSDVATKADADPGVSYTARLIQAGPMVCAKKLGEEGVELALAIAAGQTADIAGEAADLLYHLAVAIAARGVDGGQIAEALAKRRGTSGLEEKANRP